MPVCTACGVTHARARAAPRAPTPPSPAGVVFRDKGVQQSLQDDLGELAKVPCRTHAQRVCVCVCVCVCVYVCVRV